MSGLVPGKELLVLLVGVATIACGCAHPDWIESTLVTVNVSGTWVGTFTAGPYGRGNLTLTLQQRGPKVTGKMVYSGGTGVGPQMSGQRVDEEITGTVNGDVLRARGTSGVVQVELTVADSEMAGGGVAFGVPARFVLRQKDHQESP
jgi:hypothetical protein